ncbi:unnamed protein product [Pedinophyceae sp. YPF-701]|nr:unnamed protein product [Pedinophyceae sp. YPF-701]
MRTLGASRGLGAEYTRQLLQRPNYQVVATCRRPENSAELQDLAAEHGSRLTVLPLDVQDEASIAAVARDVHARHAAGVDLLINASGVLHIPDTGLQPETSISRLERDNMNYSFAVNAMGPLLVCKHFVPLMQQRSGSESGAGARPRVIANMSARIGSVADNGLGGWYSYRASKAALNQMSRSLSIELERKKAGVAVLLLHPGTCDTGLTKPFQKNVPKEKLFTRERGVRQLLGLIDGATIDDNGSFWAWDGQTIPW